MKAAVEHERRAAQPQRRVGLGELVDAGNHRRALLELGPHRRRGAQGSVGGGPQRLRRLVGLDGVERPRSVGCRFRDLRLLQERAQILDDSLRFWRIPGLSTLSSAIIPSMPGRSSLCDKAHDRRVGARLDDAPQDPRHEHGVGRLGGRLHLDEIRCADARELRSPSDGFESYRSP